MDSSTFNDLMFGMAWVVWGVYYIVTGLQMPKEPDQ